jgi:UDP-glucuronate 4-epimerase
MCGKECQALAFMEGRLKYFITGTAGFIGYHLARRLLEDGHDVTGFDGLTPYYDVTLKHRRHEILGRYPRFKAVIGMLEDAAALSSAVEASSPEIVVHLAAQAGVRYSLENPRAYVDSNLTGSWNLIEAVRRVAPRHLLLASSSSVYGANDKVPFAENDLCDEPLTLYAATKKSMEVMAHSQSHLHRIPTTAFRFFTVYGPWGRPDMALFKFVEAILDGRPIEIYGEGQMSRDFTYVDDLVEAIVRLAAVAPDESSRVTRSGVTDSLSRQAPFRVVNIGGGRPIPLLRFVDTVEAAIGQPAIRKMLPMQKGDVPRTYASADLLEALTGYRPSTSVEVGVQAFVDWYRAEMVAPTAS